MPRREIIFSLGEIYHVFNRGIDHRETFTNEGQYKRALLTLEFYQAVEPPMKLSEFLSKLTKEEQEKDLNRLRAKDHLADIISFSFMPNHFHLVLRQRVDGGISKFMSNFQNSYTRFFNTIHERVGPLFLNQFKAVRINNEGQLLHTVRYTLLNPYIAGVAPTLKELEEHKWSALPEYLGRIKREICEKTMVLSSFKSRGDFKRFIFDRADYQKSLEEIKRLIIE